MSETIANLALKTARSLASQMEGLAKNQMVLNQNQQVLPKVVAQVNTAINQIQEQLNILSMVVGVLVDLAGREKVDEMVNSRRIEAEKAQSEAQAVELSQQVTENKMQVAEQVSEDATLVFHERKQDGTDVPVTRVQFRYADMLEEHRKNLLGQKVGHVITVDTGHTFELREIYTPVLTKPDGVQA